MKPPKTPRKLQQRSVIGIPPVAPGQINWTYIWPTVEELRSRKWLFREIWVWLISEGVEMPEGKFRIFQSSAGRRFNSRKAQLKTKAKS